MKFFISQKNEAPRFFIVKKLVLLFFKKRKNEAPRCFFF